MSLPPPSSYVQGRFAARCANCRAWYQVALSPAMKGIIFMNLTVFCFSYSNAFVKGLSGLVSSSEMLFYRSLFFFVPFILVMLFRRGYRGTRQLFATDHRALQLGRGICGGVGLLLIFYAFTVLPLSVASALSFSGSLFVTALSAPILRERVGPKRWTAVVIGFLGILLVAKPTEGGFLHASLLGTGAALVGTLLDSVSLVYNRYLSRFDSFMTIFTYYSLAGLIVSALFLMAMVLFGGLRMAELGPVEIFLLLGMASGSALGQYFVTLAFSYAEASLIAPIIYMLMAWGTLFGYVFWGEVPTLETLLGAAVVIVVGIYVTRRA